MSNQFATPLSNPAEICLVQEGETVKTGTVPIKTARELEIKVASEGMRIRRMELALSKLTGGHPANCQCTGCETLATLPDPPLENIKGDLLPAVGEKVKIHLASQDAWVPHTVVGYYVHGDSNGNPALQRVNIRVRHSNGSLNARLLMDVRRMDDTPYIRNLVVVPNKKEGQNNQA